MCPIILSIPVIKKLVLIIYIPKRVLRLQKYLSEASNSKSSTENLNYDPINNNYWDNNRGINEEQADERVPVYFLG